MNKTILDSAMKEVSELKTVVEVLNGGTSGTTAYVSLRYAARAVTKQKAEVDKAAACLHAWLIKDVSPLRSLLAYLSGAGCWYAAACHEKTARAFVSKMSKESFQSIAAAAHALRYATRPRPMR